MLHCLHDFITSNNLIALNNLITWNALIMLNDLFTSYYLVALNDFFALNNLISLPGVTHRTGHSIQPTAVETAPMEWCPERNSWSPTASTSFLSTLTL